MQPTTMGASKYGYLLSSLVVCHDMHHTTYYVAGLLGSAHDNQVFHKSQMFQNPNK